MFALFVQTVVSTHRRQQDAAPESHVYAWILTSARAVVGVIYQCVEDKLQYIVPCFNDKRKGTEFF